MMEPGVSAPTSVLLALALIVVSSIFCAFASALLIYALARAKEYTSYVMLIACATFLTTINAMLQNIYFAIRWRRVCEDRYEATIAAHDDPSLAFGALTSGFESALYWIEFLLYNIDSLLIMFWAIALTCTLWSWHPISKAKHVDLLGKASKVVAIAVPASVATIHASTQFHLSFAGGFMVTSVLLLVSFTIDALCLFLIITKYIRIKRSIHRTATGPFHGGRYAMSSLSLDEGSPSGTGPRRKNRSKLRVNVDPILVVRFVLALAILLSFQAYLIYYSISRYKLILTTKPSDGPDFTAKSSIKQALNLVPGVTASLLAFCLFGSSPAQRRIYVELFTWLLCRGRPRQSSSSKANASTRFSQHLLLQHHVSREGSDALERGPCETTDEAAKDEKGEIHVASEILITREASAEREIDIICRSSESRGRDNEKHDA